MFEESNTQHHYSNFNDSCYDFAHSLLRNRDERISYYTGSNHCGWNILYCPEFSATFQLPCSVGPALVILHYKEWSVILIIVFVFWFINYGFVKGSISPKPFILFQSSNPVSSPHPEEKKSEKAAHQAYKTSFRLELC